MSHKKTHILIVDDNKENIKVLETNASDGHVVTHVHQSVDDALRDLTLFEIGLAILDVEIPGVNGFELAQIIRGIKRYSNLPVIFITSIQNISHVMDKGYALGAVDVWAEPLVGEIIKSKIRVFVELQQQKILLKDQLKELKKLRQIADSANKSKTFFLANMSHEIRTPLSSVIGYSELLAKGQLSSAEISDCANAIMRNGRFLIKLVDDILDLSKFDSDPKLEETEASILECLSEVEKILEHKAKSKGITLQIIAPQAIDSIHIFDPHRLKQIFLNIIGNAIKFTAVGKVVVILKIFKKSYSEDSATITVSDQGIGIEENMIDRLFQPFSQLTQRALCEEGGVGLGLVIARRIAQAMGGDVKIVSTKVGVGSVIEIHLTLKKGVKNHLAEKLLNAQKENQNGGDFEKKKILVVDDSEDNLYLIQMFLKDTKAELTMARDGLEALSRFGRERFDLILMDVQMPGMNGILAAKEIRKIDKKIPIIALTATTPSCEYDDFHTAEFTSVLTKPFFQETLLKKISLFIV